MQLLPKRLKLENPTAPSFPYHGMFYTMAALNVQPSYAELPPLVQLSESPVSYNSEGGVELLPKLLDGSTVANRMGMIYEYGEDSTSPKEMGHNMEEWSIELISKLIEDSPSAKEIDMNIEEENVELMSKLLEDSSNAKEMGKDVAESFPGPPEVVETDAVGSHREEDIGFINVIDNADNARGHFHNLEINALPIFSEELAAG
ncbi:hypothetical protein Gotri_020153 [Gossypium trilobum]|uniref:Uncharacterized protein n=1 Tax=Gossypium trilobum TaxID=34281 RepID=A0A7J9D8G8_9ROSI|nr:hypothetical protein [Gossypium trilobum]